MYITKQNGKMKTYEITKSKTTGNLFVSLSSWENTKENKDLIHEMYFNSLSIAEIYWKYNSPNSNYNLYKNYSLFPL